MAKGARLRLWSLRSSWVQIPPPAPFYSQGIPPGYGIARTSKIESKHSEWKALAKLSVERHGVAVVERTNDLDKVELEDRLPSVNEVNDIEKLYNTVKALGELHTTDKHRMGKISRKLGMFGQKWAIASINAAMGHIYECCFGRGEPDGKPISDVYRIPPAAVKLVRLRITYSGGRNVKGQKFVYSFLASRDAKAEVEWAKQHGLNEIWLIVVNISNLKWIFNGPVKFDETITIRDYNDMRDARFRC